ncbi:MAG: hypothetical protein PWP23_460 [Candidatus Sumerlaeota bacterium]|nr:hypothetical protein [Candidatus Sumerlaeota bacterium]
MSRPLTIMVNLLHAQATLTGTGYYARYMIDALLRHPARPRIIGLASPINRRAFALPDAPPDRFRLLTWGRPWKRVMARRLEEWVFLESAIREMEPDVFWGPSNFLPWRHVAPMVATIHDMTFFEHPETLPPLRRFYWHRWTHATIRVADAIMTDSEASRRDILRYGKPDPRKLTVVPIGAGAPYFIGRDDAGRASRAQALRTRFPNLPDKYVLFLGTLTAHKNVPRLVDAVAWAQQHGAENIHLVLAGKRGHDYEKIAATIQRHGMAKQVHELGYVEDAFLPALYENARLHVLPSFTEGFGLPIVEAMACGTPVVTGDVGAMAEVADNAALLVHPTDTTAMGEAIRLLWKDEALWQRMRTRGILRADAFTWEKAAHQAYDILERTARNQ